MRDYRLQRFIPLDADTRPPFPVMLSSPVELESVITKKWPIISPHSVKVGVYPSTRVQQRSII